MKEKQTISRRNFLVKGSISTLGVLALGTFVGCAPIQRKIAGFANTAEPPYLGNKKDPMVWFEITKNNNVIFYSPKVEMGQGIFTGLAQIVADELEVNIDQVIVKNAPSTYAHSDKAATGGSLSMLSLWQPLRELSATMREMLKKQAAKKLGVEIEALSIKDGVISTASKTMTYAEVADGVKRWSIPKKPELKDPKKYKYVGKPVPRVDLKEKVLGTAIFGMDATFPDMLYGALVYPPTLETLPKTVDLSAAKRMPGVVKVFHEKDFIGVAAKTFIEAENAKKAIKIEWLEGKKWQQEDIDRIVTVGNGEEHVIQKVGNAKRILKKSNDIVELQFRSPLGAHAQMEPCGATVYVQDDKVTVRMATQGPRLLASSIAKRLDLKPKDVELTSEYLGGGFGRRQHDINALAAAVMSKATGKPVKCFFNRLEEFQNDPMRPPTHNVLRAKLTNDGKIEAFEHQVASGKVVFGTSGFPPIVEKLIGADPGSWRGGMVQYRAIPNINTVCWMNDLPFPTSSWRSLGLLGNTFAIESFMDELAIKADKDPVQFRLSHINDDEAGERLKNTIKAAAEKANYRDKVINGRAMGFACSTDVNTPCAQVAEVSIENDQIKVHKVTCAIDAGLAVNPDQVIAQCEGALTMGLSASMYERMYIKDNKIQPTIYGAYDMALIKHAPKEIDVVILEGTGTPGGIGEPPLGPIGAAIANAVRRLTGQRLKELPLTLNQEEVSMSKS